MRCRAAKTLLLPVLFAFFLLQSGAETRNYVILSVTKDGLRELRLSYRGRLVLETSLASIQPEGRLAFNRASDGIRVVETVVRYGAIDDCIVSSSRRDLTSFTSEFSQLRPEKMADTEDEVMAAYLGDAQIADQVFQSKHSKNSSESLFNNIHNISASHSEHTSRTINDSVANSQSFEISARIFSTKSSFFLRLMRPHLQIQKQARECRIFYEKATERLQMLSMLVQQVGEDEYPSLASYLNNTAGRHLNHHPLPPPPPLHNHRHRREYFHMKKRRLISGEEGGTHVESFRLKHHRSSMSVNDTQAGDYSRDTHGGIQSYDIRNSLPGNSTQQSDTSYDKRQSDTSHDKHQSDTSYDKRQSDSSHDTLHSEHTNSTHGNHHLYNISSTTKLDSDIPTTGKSKTKPESPSLHHSSSSTPTVPSSPRSDTTAKLLKNSETSNGTYRNTDTTDVTRLLNVTSNSLPDSNVTNNTHQDTSSEERYHQVSSPDLPFDSTKTGGKHARAKRDLLTGWMIFPGTKWCGDGDIAEHKKDVGYHVELDKCCRRHDLCPLVIPRLSWKYGMFNYRLHTLSHCRCDRKFRKCLKASTSPLAHLIGQIYFNVVGPQCFKFTQQSTCTHRFWWGGCREWGNTKVAFPKKQRSFK